MDADTYVPVKVHGIAVTLAKASRIAFLFSRAFLRATRIILRLFTWLFLADFALHFAHAKRDGKSLPELVHWLSAPIQDWAGQVSQIDLRYTFRFGLVDFMPLALMIGFLVLRMRVDSLREWLEPKKSPERGGSGKWSTVGQASSQKKKLLIADPNRMWKVFMRKKLRESYEVQRSDNMEGIVKTIVEESPDILIIPSESSNAEQLKSLIHDDMKMITG